MAKIYIELDFQLLKEVKMENKKCSICNKKVYSELGKGCMLCGMPMEDESKEFCSKMCRRRYKQIHENKNLVDAGQVTC